MDWKTLLFSFKGRINRAKWWLGLLFIFLIYLGIAVVGMIIAGLIEVAIGSPASAFVYGATILAAALAGIWAHLAISTKRLHDRGKGAIWLLLFFVAPVLLSGMTELNDALLILALLAFVLSVWAMVELGCLKGTGGPNAYGPDPLASTVVPDDGRTEPA